MSKIQTIVDMSDIRIQKLLEISQSAVSYFFVGFTVGIFLETLLPKVTHVKQMSTSKILFALILRFIILSIAVFYIHKIVQLIPFIFHYSDNYIPGIRGESKFGGTVLLIAILYRTQPSIYTLIDELNLRAITKVNSQKC